MVWISNWEFRAGESFISAPYQNYAHICALYVIADFVQLALAVAKTFEGPSSTSQDTAFRNPDQHALCSFLTFLLGAFLGRIGDRIGPHKRRWLVSATFVQSLLTMAAAITIWKSSQDSRDGPTRFSIADERGDPAWTHALTFACIGFMSASMGLQGVVAKRLNTEFAASSKSSGNLYGVYMLTFYPSRTDYRLD